MTDSRLELAIDWLKSINQSGQLTLLAGDASIRRYFRLDNRQGSYILMDCPPQQESIDTFIKLAKQLKKFENNTFEVPAIHHYDASNGFVVLQDLGDELLIKTYPAQLKQNLEGALEALITLQTIPTTDLNAYHASLIYQELQLFTDWYLMLHQYPLKRLLEKDLQQLFARLSECFKQTAVFVHRDYHCRNLIKANKNPLTIGVIDFQGAVKGPYCYDLVSLLRDAYSSLSSQQCNYFLDYYYHHSSIAKQTDWDSFCYQFDWIGLQRHLKILGIFCRLSHRDGKHQYLSDLDRVEQYVIEFCHKYHIRFLLEIIQQCQKKRHQTSIYKPYHHTH